MRRQNGFTLIELLVVIAIIALLMGILMPALSRVRKQARKAACMSNVRSFALALAAYAAENDDRIIALYFQEEGEFWTEKLHGFYKAKDLRLCPAAVKPSAPETEFVHGNLGDHCNYGAPYRAWYHMRSTGNEASTMFLGSYGTNGWVHRGEGQTWGYAYEDHWGMMSVKGAGAIPLMLDCTWVAGYPLDSDQPLPADQYYEYWRGSYNFGQMNRYCFERHNGYINTSFLDGSTRAVPLAELWELKWHRSYQAQYDIEIPNWKNK